MGVKEKEALFADLARLRRAERSSPASRDIGTVRLHLEQLLGSAVTPSFAARVLGVTPSGLRRWIDRGDVAVVIDPNGRAMVPLPHLLDLAEAVEECRDAGHRHALEAAVSVSKERASRLPGIVTGRDGAEVAGAAEDPAALADRRSLAYHRALARRVDRRMANMALALVRHWRETGSIDARYANRWERILLGPVPDIRKRLEDSGEESRDLRQNSPFAGILTEAERQAIISGIG